MSTWRGYWEQRAFGRQAMHDLSLRFGAGTVRGEGWDCIGRFTFDGTSDSHGAVVMVKQYIGRHQVLYRGQFDGEGTIFGRWSIGALDSGEFVLTVVRDPSQSKEIEEIVPATRLREQLAHNATIERAPELTLKTSSVPVASSLISGNATEKRPPVFWKC